MTIEKVILNSENETKDFAIKIANQLRKGDILTLTGELGAGKTFLCRELIKHLCEPDTKVISPTFNLLQIYQTPNFEIYHFDLYRLNRLDEIYELGIEEAFNEHVCLIEWPFIIQNILPKDTISIEISIINENTRSLKISS